MTWQSDLVAVLQNSVQTQAGLDRVLNRIGKGLSTDHAKPGAFPDVALEVVAASAAGNWTRQFIRELLWQNATNSMLQAFRDANPGVSPTRLRDAEIGLLCDGMESAFRSYGELAPILGLVSRGVAADEIVERGVGDIPPDFTRRVIAWFDDRGAIEILIEALGVRADPVLVARSKSVMTGLKGREAAHGYRRPDPVETCLINGRVFIDRRPLRDAIRALSPMPTRPIVAVNGPSRWGNTFSLQLLRYVAAETGAFKLASIDLSEEQHVRFRPGDLARRIILQLGRSGDLPHMPKETDAGSAIRWALELGDWLLGLAGEANKVWVVALDRFAHPDLPIETREMIKYLVKRAAEAGSHIRVVLVAYGEGLLPKEVSAHVSFESLRELTRDDLLQWLERLADQQAIAIEEGVLDGIADSILAKAQLTNIEAVAVESQRWFDGLLRAV
jgi:hypothetical protein